MGAILLIYDYGIANIIHSNIFKMHFKGSALMGSRPCLHSHAILGVGEGTVLDTNANHRFFIGVLSKTSHADAMFRPTGYTLDINLLTAITN